MSTAKSPRSLSILFFLYLLQGLGLLAYSIYMAILEGWLTRDPGVILGRFIPIALLNEMSYSLVMVLIAVLVLLVAISLRRIKRWAWTVAVFIQGISLLFALLEYSRHRPNYSGMLFSIAIVFYLNQADVQEAFRGAMLEQNG